MNYIKWVDYSLAYFSCNLLSRLHIKNFYHYILSNVKTKYRKVFKNSVSRPIRVLNQE